MTLQQFRLLSELDKVSAILEHGMLMAQQTEEGERTFLYRFDNFFVAACYSSGTDQLININCFLEVEQAVPHFRKHLISINPAEREYQSPNM